MGASESHHMNPSQRTALQVIFEFYFVYVFFGEHAAIKNFQHAGY